MYNPRSPGVKRLMKEAKELAEPTEEYFACPLEDNIFEWHFTVRGPPSTEFEGGYYHGRILLPTQYPMQPPNIILLTPNGRFEINKKICLSISEHHPETWQPSWSIRTALLALIAFMPTASAGTIGSLDYTPDERRVLAKRSLVWECAVCGGRPAVRLLADVQPISVITQEESALIKQIALKAEEDAARKTSTSSDVAREKSMGDMLTPEVGSSSDNVARQRLNSTASIATEASVQDSLLRASINSTNRDTLWSTIIWVLVLLISLLVIRRLFFLE